MSPHTHHYHFPHLWDFKHPPRTSTTLQETALWHPEDAADGEAPRVPSRWQWCLAQVAQSVSVYIPEKKLLSAQQTPHGSYAGDGVQGREAQ